MESKRKVYEPTSAAQYYESISDCLSFNSAIEQQRTYARKRRTLVQTDGYEAVLNRSKRAQLTFSPYSNMPTSTSGMMQSTSSAMHAAKPPVAGQTVGPPPKLQQNILPMNDAMSKQLAPKLTKSTTQPPTQPVHLKSLSDGQAIFSVGSDVIVHHTEKLAAYGLGHLLGRKGTVISVPVAKGQFLYGVMFDNTVHHVPLEALVSSDAAAMLSTPSQVKLPASSQLKLEQSFHMHRLMQDQFKEIQALQKQHAEFRVANNTPAMAEVQKSLAVLRNLHLSQIRALKTKHDEELRQKELT
ncbi:hypothetical protein H257_06064 [Aphanomyces astaci]|uniref:Uncharacterized protein n=1 Tax=Aphanomyces astaci TaxID=112090 RepID=W4GRI0_APHAT|nr:hypothetical protein H257_06064 [Aphanomyces astaci]ETV81599.1 hypothetical protein H257_06064 [Aphanomyces astaci]|eukprot:XP_009829457.1 hypothetical protein H257_06064 [Aphanomyces astaci]